MKVEACSVVEADCVKELADSQSKGLAMFMYFHSLLLCPISQSGILNLGVKNLTQTLSVNMSSSINSYKLLFILIMDLVVFVFAVQRRENGIVGSQIYEVPGGGLSWTRYLMQIPS